VFISVALLSSSIPLRLKAIRVVSNPQQIGSFQHYAIPSRFNAVQFHFCFNPRFSAAVLSRSEHLRFGSHLFGSPFMAIRICSASYPGLSVPFQIASHLS
jgi:hypothetical protein